VGLDGEGVERRSDATNCGHGGYVEVESVTKSVLFDFTSKQRKIIHRESNKARINPFRILA
jgi:hypothetical protein